MKFLLPIGGELPPGFIGILTSPGHRGVPSAIRAGAPWAADNQAFTQGFNPAIFFAWLDSMMPWRDQCLFVACPDVVGSHTDTRRLWDQWIDHFAGWPVAFVGQDGETGIPAGAHALFLGGTTKWKLSTDADALIALARRRGLHVHIGRVNGGRRYRHFRMLPGSDAFTCDGTRIRYEREKCLADWRMYQEQLILWS